MSPTNDIQTKKPIFFSFVFWSPTTMCATFALHGNTATPRT